MSTQAITEFLEARVSEDEARASSGWARLGDSRWETTEYGQDFLTPSAVLAECAAKRAILAGRVRIDRSANDDEWSMGYSDANYEALQALAAVYASHADYREEWA